MRICTVCDLLTRGYGVQETPESKKKWFEMQKVTPAPPTSHNNSVISNSSTSSPAMPKKIQQTSGGPPKTGFSSTSFVNGSSSPLVSTAKVNGTNVDLQMRYLERRFDDGLGKILDQNALLLEQMLKFKEDMRELNDKVEQIAFSQRKIESEIQAAKEREANVSDQPTTNNGSLNCKNQCFNCQHPAEHQTMVPPAVEVGKISFLLH